MDRSGLGDKAIDRLSVIMSEDVSLSALKLPVAVVALREKYFTAKHAKDNQARRRALLETAEIIARSPKCRMSNNACAATLAFVENVLSHYIAFFLL